jgi:hypothetical protein
MAETIAAYLIGLQLHVPAILRSLELDHDEIGVAVNSEQIDSPLALVPFAEFLGNDQRVRRDYLNLLHEETLEIVPLVDALTGKCRLSKFGDRGLGEFVECHGSPKRGPSAPTGNTIILAPISIRASLAFTGGARSGILMREIGWGPYIDYGYERYRFADGERTGSRV